MSTTRLALTEDRWIDVKDSLKVKDRRDIHTYSVDGMSTDGQTYRFNVVKHGIAQAAARITACSIPGVKWPVAGDFKAKVAVIEDLDETVFEAITLALNTADAAQREEDAEAKNATADGESV
jgi:phenylacetate-coenzyme A ligase PaaK-like adenylate-forming protein